MKVSNTEYDEHKGRIAIGRLHAGELQRGMEVKVCTPDDACRVAKISELFVYQNFSRVPVESVSAGDICAVCGMSDIMVGGKYVTSRNLRDRLYRELERNLAMKVEDGETADTFLVSGRGTLHLTILIENMRREGYEFMIGPPKVINKTVDGKVLEPYEIAAVEVPEEYMGSVVELLGKRRGQMINMEASGFNYLNGRPEGTTLLKYKIPTRGLIGLRNAILTASRGTAVLNTIFDSYGPWAGDLSSRDQGSLVAFEDGSTTSYALLNAQERGLLFVQPGQDVYKGQIVGIHQRPGDLAINVCKKKAATNVRSNKETTVVLDEALSYSLDDCIEFIQEDELVEVTPASIRMSKNPKISKKK
ncbi:hypothetical protein HU200_011893 [Digitaria exilis]|uniref:Elongation factor EFG domain-containing protein n=1 Tax=Digitaria exilis TaxID=1010633 RepID=A0A835FFX7_9POAL|nr:hypothetical protein HU200_011893 [Digitaria exilis]